LIAASESEFKRKLEFYMATCEIFGLGGVKTNGKVTMNTAYHAKYFAHELLKPIQFDF